VTDYICPRCGGNGYITEQDLILSREKCKNCGKQALIPDLNSGQIFCAYCGKSA
jgi:DNA-directed RNA polymerase subunit RPC12/RpoP